MNHMVVLVSLRSPSGISTHLRGGLIVRNVGGSPKADIAATHTFCAALLHLGLRSYVVMRGPLL